MTLDQIQVFITLSEQLNFTKVSEILFISQSNISRMISSLESELNLQLFIRSYHSVRLTPAGLALYKEFSEAYKQIKKGISKAKDAQLGMAGEVSIGVLDGTDVSDFIPDVIAHFRQVSPNLRISLCSNSFQELIEGLYDGRLDLAITIQGHVESYPELIYEKLEDAHDNIVVSKGSPLFERETLELEDMDDMDLIVISPDDLFHTKNVVLNMFKEKHVAPNFLVAPNLRTAMLWLESGMGAAFLFSRNRLYNNEDMKSFPVKLPWASDLAIAWKKENYNTSLPVVLEYCLDHFRK